MTNDNSTRFIPSGGGRVLHSGPSKIDSYSWRLARTRKRAQRRHNPRMQGEQPGDGGYPVLMGAICRLKWLRARSRGRAFLRCVAGSATMLAQGAACRARDGTAVPGAGGREVPRVPGPDGRRVPHQPSVCAVMRLRTARPSVPPGLCPAAPVPGCTQVRPGRGCVRYRGRHAAGYWCARGVRVRWRARESASDTAAGTQELTLPICS